MVVTLLVAELVWIVYVVVERWLDLPPFNDLSRTGRRPLRARLLDTVRAAAPALAAMPLTLLDVSTGASALLRIAIAGVLFAGAAVSVETVWLAWWRGTAPRGVPLSEGHAFLEPRRPRGFAPSTLACLQSAQATVCSCLALVLVAETLGG